MTKVTPRRDPVRRNQGWMRLFGLGGPAAIAAIALAPKDPAYAASSRLTLLLGTSALAIGCTLGFAWARRRYRVAKRMARWGAASAAVRDTLNYLSEEERLAGRHHLGLLVGAQACLALHLTAHWPQAAFLAPFADVLGAGALLCVALVPIVALRNRRHAINRFFLFRYIKQQLRHLGYRPPFARAQRQSGRAAKKVAVLGEGCFAVGGFAWRFDDLTMGCLAIGQTGSGKTVCVLNALLEGLIASWREPGNHIAGLVLDAKGDFRDKIIGLCARYGRSDDLFILDPDTWPTASGTPRSIAWNPLDNDDDALEVAVRLITALRLIGLDQGQESFWLDSAKVFLRHAITLIRGAAGSTAPSILEVYRLGLEGENETPFYHSLVKRLSEAYPGDVPAEVLDALRFMESEWSKMAERQRSGVRGALTQLLDEFTVAPFRDIFTQPSTLTIGRALDDGKLVYIHMPIADRERMSRLVCALVKLEFQRQVLLRPRKVRPSFMLIDEFQAYYTSGDGRGDSDFFERSRESRHANVAASQNILAFLKKTKNPNDAKNFFGNCAVKIFLRNTEEETNRWASALFGQRNEIVITTNEQAAIDGHWSRRHHTSYGRGTRTLPRVPPEAFATLAIPVRGDPERQHAASIVHIASRGDTEQHRLDWPVNPLR